MVSYAVWKMRGAWIRQISPTVLSKKEYFYLPHPPLPPIITQSTYIDLQISYIIPGTLLQFY